MTDLPVIDYRRDDDFEPICPECGAPVESSAELGKVNLSALDMEAHDYSQYGVTAPGIYGTIWQSWWCSADENHYWGPTTS